MQVAGRRDHHVAGGVVRPHVAGQRVAPHLAYQGFRAQGRAPHRLARERGLLEVVEDDVVRGVVGLPDLLQDHAALALDLLRRERAVGQDVADDVGAERQVLLEQLDVVGGLLAGGVGVDVAADVLDLLGDPRRRAALGALEGHVLEEVRHAVLAGPLVPGAAGDIGAEGDGLDPVHALGHDGKAARQAGGGDRVVRVSVGHEGPDAGPVRACRAEARGGWKGSMGCQAAFLSTAMRTAS